MTTKITCDRCHRPTHPVEMLLNRAGHWRCARCIEDERVQSNRFAATLARYQETACASR